MNKSSIEYNQEKEYLTKIIHDLKTPISAQIKALEIFLSGSEKNLSQEESDLIKLTLNSCIYTQRLVENYNSICSLEKNVLILNCENFNITDLAKNAVEELDILLKFSELKIAITNDKEKIIFADKLQIKRVIINLLSNSINYAFKNTTIDIDLQIENNRLFFEIKNKSPYIEPEFLKKIFDKYQTRATSYNKSGTGLGLYLSKEIINAHGGKIYAKSYIDETNIFGFWLPIRQKNGLPEL